MDWIKNDPRRARQVNADPRIDSPEIKVVYPSQAGVAKDTIATTPATQLAAVQIAVPGSPVQPTTQTVTEPPQVVKTTAPETVTTTEPLQGTKPAAPKFIDTLKQNAMLLIIVALISLGIGIMAGKKMKT